MSLILGYRGPRHRNPVVRRVCYLLVDRYSYSFPVEDESILSELVPFGKEGFLRSLPLGLNLLNNSTH